MTLPRRSVTFETAWALLLFLGVVLSVVPLWAPLLMAGWAAVLVMPLQRTWSRRLGGRQRAAAAISVLMSLTLLAPMALFGAVLWYAAIEINTLLHTSSGGSEALKKWLSSASGTESVLSWQQLRALTEQHSSEVWAAAGSTFERAMAVSVGLFIFVTGFYTFLLKGQQTYAWLGKHLPVPPQHLDRMAAAYTETGYGLFIGMGLTALIQGGIATVGYVLLNVPQALVLGLLTVLVSVFPLFGSGLVWFPVSIGLLLAGRDGTALGVVAVGLVVSVADNLVRPYLASRADLRLNGFVVLVAMLGGSVTFGAFGLLLGPLLARLGVEAASIYEEERMLAQVPAGGS